MHHQGTLGFGRGFFAFGVDIWPQKAHTTYMRLTDSTVVRQLGNGRVVVTEGKAPAVFVPAEDVFMCGWERPFTSAELAERSAHGWYPDFPSDLVTICEAKAVGFDNGFACCAGHEHRSDAEYFTEDEAEACLRASGMLPANARLMDGRSL